MYKLNNTYRNVFKQYYLLPIYYIVYISIDVHIYIYIYIYINTKQY